MILKDLKFEFKDVISESEIIDAFNEVYAYTKNKWLCHNKWLIFDEK